MATLLAPKILGVLRAFIDARAAAHGQSAARRARRRRRDDPVGAVRADHDDDADAPGVGDPASARTPAGRRRAASTRGTPWAHAAAPALAADAVGHRRRGRCCVYVSLPLFVWMSPALVGLVLRAAVVGGERQRRAREDRALPRLLDGARGSRRAARHRAARRSRSAPRRVARRRDDRAAA